MLFIFPQGRLGNQIFQYMFAKSILTQKEQIVTTNAEYFATINELNKKFIIIPTGRFFKYINFGLNRFFLILATCRIITHIKQTHTSYQGFPIENNCFVLNKGLFRNLKYIDGYFIYEGAHIVGKNITLNQKYLNAAKDFLSHLPRNDYKVFIHLRRGDYLKWSILGNSDLSLPLSFYTDAIAFFQKKYHSVSFVFLSDDIEYVEINFSHIKNKIISKNTIGIDLAIMTLCDGAVISPSSISYVGAYFMKNTLEIFAPNYWLGFKAKEWYPKGINTKKFQYLDIN